MSTLVIAVISTFLATINSAPCVPANVCFPNAVGDGTLSSSAQMICNSPDASSYPGVNRGSYAGSTDCTGQVAVAIVNSENDVGVFSGSAYYGFQTTGSGSGTIGTDYLQGYNCPLLSDSSEDCEDYMVVRRYGQEDYSTQNSNGDTVIEPYFDIGDDCVGKGDEYDVFVIPVGCVGIDAAGSNNYGVNSTHFWYDHFTSKTCDDTWESAQSDIWEWGVCGHFEETTHCGDNSRVSGGTRTICNEDPDDGVTVEYDYWFDVLCAPDWANAGVPSCTEDYNTAGSQPGSGPAPAYVQGTPAPITPAPITPTEEPTDDQGNTNPGNSPVTQPASQPAQDPASGPSGSPGNSPATQPNSSPASGPGNSPATQPNSSPASGPGNNSPNSSPATSPVTGGGGGGGGSSASGRITIMMSVIMGYIAALCT